MIMDSNAVSSFSQTQMETTSSTEDKQVSPYKLAAQAYFMTRSTNQFIAKFIFSFN